MKRILNAYAVHRDLAILGGLDVLGDPALRGQLALWTILSMRWPLLRITRSAAAGEASSRATIRESPRREAFMFIFCIPYPASY